ncbi:RING finger protein 222-like [Acipenser oxyrinchus oxyrinchus]|uniref:RING finger protein 222-like n=1 Tax=Acipenser oxyrinchus oxyrinchus TaxID=40147 RepID=A0AAD8D2C1_ACIOX|nr:RING finger protein 222-like [Acipenser oxyrinchus oxyrinchus]
MSNSHNAPPRQPEESDENEAGSDECPVCYESYREAKRTLACGHVFCHDCLVKTLVSHNRDGDIVRKNIICPICRHLTYIKKKKILPLIVTSKKNKQTLEVPLSPVSPITLSASSPFNSLDSLDEVGSPTPARTTRSRRIQDFAFRRTDSSGSDLTAATTPTSATSPSQIFTISGHGRPMSEEDTVSITAGTVNRQARCCRLQWVIFFLIVIIIVAIVAAILPWIILKRDG